MRAFIAAMQKNKFKVAAFAAIVLVAAAFVYVIAMNIVFNFFSYYSPDSKGIGFFYILIPAFIFIIVVLTAVAISVAIREREKLRKENMGMFEKYIKPKLTWYDIIYIVLNGLVYFSIAMVLIMTNGLEDGKWWWVPSVVPVIMVLALTIYNGLVMQKKSKEFKERSDRTEKAMGKKRRFVAVLCVSLAIATFLLISVLEKPGLAIAISLVFLLFLIAYAVYIAIKARKK